MNVGKEKAKDTNRMLKQVQHDLFRKMPKYNDGVVRILHLLPGEVRERVNRGRVEEILSGLKEKERRALELRFGFVDGKMLSYEKMGEELGMTSMGAMKLFKRTLKKVVDSAV